MRNSFFEHRLTYPQRGVGFNGDFLVVWVRREVPTLSAAATEQEQEVTKLMKSIALLEAGQQRANTRAD